MSFLPQSFLLLTFFCVTPILGVTNSMFHENFGKNNLSFVSQSSENFLNKWPQKISLKDVKTPTIITEENTNYVYETEHFRYNSDTKLSVKLIGTLAQVFETTYQANIEIPLNFPCRKQLDSSTKKFDIILIRELDRYKSMVPIPESAGIYTNGKVIVPFDSLNLVKQGGKYSINKTGDMKTLIHEITHQMTIDPYLQPYPSWFAEGIAEYVSVSAYQSGTLNFSKTRSNMIKYVTEYGQNRRAGRALGKKINIMPLINFLNLPYDVFINKNPQINYGVALLLAYYFFHLDNKGNREAITKFMKAYQKGEPSTIVNEQLLNGRTWNELEQQITKAMKSLQITLTFKADVPVLSTTSTSATPK